MTRPIALALALLLALAAPAHAAPCPAPGIHYAPTENLERIDVALIGCATQTIDVAAYVMTSFAVIDALRDAARRGVSVRLYADANARALHPRAQALDAEPGVEIRRKRATTFMHLKSYLVDGKTLRTGAANFSPGGLKQQDNDLIILNDADAAARFAATFTTIWGR